METRVKTGTPGGRMVLSPRPGGWAWPGVVATKVGDSLAGPGETVTVWRSSDEG